MALNYAEKWAPDLLEIKLQETITSPFIVSNVNWVGAQEFHFTSMSLSGFKNHNRAGGWNAGTVAQADHAYKVNHDRDIEFLVDKADVDETNATASIKNVAEVFEHTQAAPELDARFFEKVSAAAIAATGYHSTTAINSYTAANVYTKLKTFLSAGKLRRYRANGSLVMYVNSTVMDLLEKSTELTRKIELTQVAEGGLAIETRITYIDGVPVMEVIDDERFFTEFNYADGFTAKTGSYAINVLIASLETVKTVPKISSIYYFEPGAHTKGDGYLFQDRQMFDTFVLPNGATGAVDSVYVDYDTTAVS